MIEIREYLEQGGRNLFGDWFDRLNSEAARRVTTALYRLGLGNFSNVKALAAESLSAASTLVRDTGFTSAKTEKRSSSCSRAARNSVSRTI